MEYIPIIIINSYKIKMAKQNNIKHINNNNDNNNVNILFNAFFKCI